MPTAWNGPTPALQPDASAYELGTEYRAEQDVTVTHVRVWTPAEELTVANRRGRVWSTAGALLGDVALPADLPTGWSSHLLPTPISRTAGERFVVSYSTGGNYGYVGAALGVDVPSADAAVTALASSNATAGNGVFSTSPGVHPTNGSGGSGFYGVDVEYVLGLGGVTASRITAAQASVDDADVTVTVAVEDDETLVGATVRVDWGDGSSATVVSAATGQAIAAHTYTESGLYALLVTVTDADGLTDHTAVPVDVRIPAVDLGKLDAGGILDEAQSHAMRLGVFDVVNGHEPKAKPGTGVTVAFWMDWLGPYVRESGLSATSARLILNARLYRPMQSSNPDAIDPELAHAAAVLIGSYSGDYDLDGLVDDIDLLGRAGVPLAGQAGYLNQDGALYRVITVRIPLIVHNAWEQAR